MPVHPRLRDIDLTKKLSKEAYRRKAKENQVKLVQLQGRIRKLHLPVVVIVEGWDAAGKGGTIRRLIQNLDPRHYRVHSVSKPTLEELGHHYLWRFWVRLPTRGQTAVFDRSWYGRVLVERVEGFARPEEWKRGYQEINEFERQLVDDGHLVLKFFLHISKEVQKHRFDKREKNPLKQWKMNEEDWRNRKRWNEYETAVDEMFVRTHTRWAPWVVVPANDKQLARITIQDRFIAAVEKALRTSKG